MKIKFVVLLSLILCSTSIPQNGQNKKLNAFYKSIEEENTANYQKAAEHLTSIYSEYKSDYLTNLRLGWLYFLMNDFDNSVKYYQNAVRLSNNSIEARLGLTYPYSKTDKWDEIVAIYKNILSEDDNNYTANLRLGQYYLNTGNYLNSKIYLEKNFENYPSDYENNLYLGWTYHYLGNNAKARDYFVDALIANPNDPDALEGLKYTNE